MADQKWLYSSTENPVFRICIYCGSAFRIQNGERVYHFCPHCGKELEE